MSMMTRGWGRTFREGANLQPDGERLPAHRGRQDPAWLHLP